MKGIQEIAFEHIVDDRIYKFTLPHGAPLGEAYQAAIIFLEEMVRMINEHTEKTLKKEEGPSKDDASKESVPIEGR